MQVILTFQFKIPAQVQVAYLFVFGQLFGSSVFEYLSFNKQISTVANGEGFVYVVIGNEYPDILMFKPCYHGLNIFYRNGVNACKRLVKQHEFGVNSQGPGYFRSSAFAAAEGVSIIFSYMMKAELVQQGFQLYSLLLFGKLRHFQYGQYIVFYAKLAKYRRFLGQVANPILGTFVHGHPRNVFRIKINMPFIGLNKSHDHVEGGSLSGAIRAKQTHYLPLLNINRHMVYHGTVTVAFNKALGMYSYCQIDTICAKIPEKIKNYPYPERFNYLTFRIAGVCLRRYLINMKVIDHIKQAKDTLISFEILPPLKGKTINSIYDHLDPLMEFKPSFINVTYHRAEHVFKKKGDGKFEKVEVRKRPGTVGICAAIMNYYHVDAVPHLICGGFTKRETEDALIDLNFIGVDNVLVLRGDAAKNETFFEPEPEGNRFALDLMKQVIDLNNGIYLEEDIRDGFRTKFCVGVAGYPEKHFEAPNMDTDLSYLKAKIDAGADYIVTQMFFDNQKYFEFVKKCREHGIEVPIIPGLKPITNKKQMSVIPRTFHVDLPSELSAEITKCKEDKDVELVGTEWLLQQSRELKKAGVPVLHYYTLGKPKVIWNVVKELV
jgi:methylenetetrahydrofolate reductase (NADPH)